MTQASSPINLHFYEWFEGLGWPRSYVGKVFAIAFIATHIPLVALVLYFALNSNNSSLIIACLLVLMATLGGTVLVICALNELLKPVQLAATALKVYFEHERVLHVPTDFRDEVGGLLKHVAIAIETFEQRRLSLEQIAFQDFLTGLLNRRAAAERLQQSWDMAVRCQVPLCIALLDIDYFKRINDNYGHATGDHVLMAMSDYLRSILRGSDWVARWGGEEFLLVLLTDTEGARKALERIRLELSRLTVMAGENNLHFTVSIGYAPIDSIGQPETVIARADRALYRSKDKGRNCIEVWSESS